jgi:hypothetical protein
MLGANYQQQINNLLSEFGSQWIELKASFDYVYEAAKDFAKETGSCHNSQTITTVASTAGYNLNPDFLEILTKDDNNFAVIQYYDGTNTYWLNWESYSDFIQNNNSAGMPTSFAILDASIPSRMTGTATSSGTASGGGESVLTDTGGSFLTLFPGDSVINTLSGKGYLGVVLSTPSTATAVTTAMFDLTSRGGAYASWASSDTYIIQPSPRYKIFLDPPPNTSSQTVTVSYIAKPSPVYSDYGTYPFATGYEEALIKYATWLYKYRDSKPQLADPLYVAYERQMRKGKNVNRKAIGSVGFRVNFMK